MAWKPLPSPDPVITANPIDAIPRPGDIFLILPGTIAVPVSKRATDVTPPCTNSSDPSP